MELPAAVLVRDESCGAFVTHSFRQQSEIPCFTCALRMRRKSESISLSPIVASRFSTASATARYDRVSPAPSAPSPARPSAEIPPVRRLIGRRAGGWDGMGRDFWGGGGIIVFFFFFVFFLIFVCF
jgi:hypothetical protein